MKQREKYLSGLTPTEKLKYAEICKKIILNDWIELDIKKLQGGNNLYRCRVGKIRVIFSVEKNLVKIEYMGSRGDIYK